MKNAAEKDQGKPTQEYPEAQISELGEEEYFYEDSDEEMEIITWQNNTTGPIWWENENELMNANEYMTQEWEEELINSEEITWLTKNGYQNGITNNYYLENKPQPMNCDEAYLIDIPQWGEAAEGLEFEGSSDEEYEDTG
ncbi:6521_t:CDS:2 [Dentiscutata erythropus]|uniref:6521_t:CDS:1 n=1 Tax=Dentiscutata erythropus TaxID=1348616 RepID=A0A9N9NTN4_9GLOM|nr:6521_t:CDS:2 [Dentiscutata erythropus]